MASQKNITRRRFLGQGGVTLAMLTMPPNIKTLIKNSERMNNNKIFDVIIIGGSYSGLAAAMALGRALRNVLIIDNGKPANIQTPFSHNFITQDGKTPKEISKVARQQVEKYDTVHFLRSTVTEGKRVNGAFEIKTEEQTVYQAKKIILATGIIDIMPDIKGFSDCWGITALHCPYCHGYEVKNETTGVLDNGAAGYEFTMMISNWTKDLTLFTNGPANLSDEQQKKLKQHHIAVNEKEILKLEHREGHLEKILFRDGTEVSVKALYSKRPFKHRGALPEKLGCELNDEGYVRTNPFQRTTVDGIYACGDNTTRMRTIANAVAMGTTAGMMVNKELIEESF